MILRKSLLNNKYIFYLWDCSPNKNIYTDTKRNNSEIYGASKAGVIQMTKYFATRYANIPITVNSIAQEVL